MDSNQSRVHIMFLAWTILAYLSWISSALGTGEFDLQLPERRIVTVLGLMRAGQSLLTSGPIGQRINSSQAAKVLSRPGVDETAK
jgi:hypothetical protein